MAAAPIGPLAWELPYAASEALKDQKKKDPRGGSGEFGVGRCKLLRSEWINNGGPTVQPRELCPISWDGT